MSKDNIKIKWGEKIVEYEKIKHKHYKPKMRIIKGEFFLSNEPKSPKKGDVVFSTDDERYYIYNGKKWKRHHGNIGLKAEK